jgi:hypothetical protein
MQPKFLSANLSAKGEGQYRLFTCNLLLHTDKKENHIFLIYKEIQEGAFAKSYMRKGFLIYEEMRKFFGHGRPL